MAVQYVNAVPICPPSAPPTHNCARAHTHMYTCTHKHTRHRQARTCTCSCGQHSATRLPATTCCCLRPPRPPMALLIAAPAAPAPFRPASTPTNGPGQSQPTRAGPAAAGNAQQAAPSCQRIAAAVAAGAGSPWGMVAAHTVRHAGAARWRWRWRWQSSTCAPQRGMAHATGAVACGCGGKLRWLAVGRGLVASRPRRGGPGLGLGSTPAA